jgi:transcriptional regulator with XRE-family HTH domain
MFQLTQNEVADALSVDRSTYAYYESGKSIPPMEVLTRFAGIFSIPLSLITNGTLSAAKDEPMVTTPSSQLVFHDSDNPIKALYANQSKENNTLSPEESFCTLPADEKELLVRYRLMKATRKSQEEKNISSAEIMNFLNQSFNE